MAKGARVLLTQTMPTDTIPFPRPFAVIRDGDIPPASLRGAAVAIGNFDGLHLGHQRLIEAARSLAGGRPAAVLTFEPHPRSYFAPDAPFFRLTPEPVKLKVLSRLGLDGVFVKRFDAALAATSAEDFVAALIGTDIGAAVLVVGADFHFGRGRAGTPAVLAALAARHGMALHLEGTVEVDGRPVSSSRVRSALEAGDVAAANRLLGYRWFVGGIVQHGDARGRTLGYPTANLRLADTCRLAHGIYAVRVARPDGSIRDGVASFGRRPTFDNGAPLLETFVLDFAGDLYGETLEVELVGHIRAEERFDDADALILRMRQDEAEARAILHAETGAGRSMIGSADPPDRRGALSGVQALVEAPHGERVPDPRPAN